jgi:hypothetical protein
MGLYMYPLIRYEVQFRFKLLFQPIVTWGYLNEVLFATYLVVSKGNRSAIHYNGLWVFAAFLACKTGFIINAISEIAGASSVFILCVFICYRKVIVTERTGFIKSWHF